MNRRLPIFLGLVAVLLSPVGTLAGTQSKMERAVAEANAHGDQLSAEYPSGVMPQRTDKTKTAIPADPDSVVLGDAKSRQRYLEAMQRYYAYRADGYAYRSRVFEWQLLSSRIIFIVVLVLVGVGIFFAAVQFRVAMRAVTQRAGVEAEPVTTGSAMPMMTQFEVSAKGIVVNSSVMGVIILALSLAFFYLYLVYVYPINDVL